MKTRIIVDSTTDLLPDIKSRVYTVPLTVHFGNEEYIDGVTIDHKTFYEKLIECDVLLGYTGISDALLQKYIEDSKHIWEGNLEEIRYTSISSVVGTHVGPGTIGVAFFRK